MRGRLVIPMAGDGRRFREAGFIASKPFVDVRGVPMVARTMHNLPTTEGTTLVARSSDRQEIEERQVWFGGCDVVYLDKPTDGPARTLLAGLPQPADVRPIVAADCDTLVDWHPEHFASWIEREDPDGALVVTRADGDQYSYARTGPGWEVVETAEKKQISDTACCGIWYWRSAEFAAYFLGAMVKNGVMVNGEYYVAPSFNHMIGEGYRVLAYPVSRLFSMGTPEDLAETIMLVQAKERG